MTNTESVPPAKSSNHINPMYAATQATHPKAPTKLCFVRHRKQFLRGTSKYREKERHIRRLCVTRTNLPFPRRLLCRVSCGSSCGDNDTVVSAQVARNTKYMLVNLCWQVAYRILYLRSSLILPEKFKVNIAGKLLSGIQQKGP